MPASKPRKFRPHWALQYALAVVARDPQTGLPTKAVCLMCRAFERDETEGAKRRKPKTKVHHFSQPWRPDNMRRHLEQQHARRWTQYKELGDEAKRQFFPANVAISNLPRAHASEQLQVRAVTEHNTAVTAAKSETFLLDRNVVELLKTLVVSEDETEVTKFQLQEDEEMDEDNALYVMKVDSMLQLDTIVTFVAGGVSLKQAVRLYQGMMGGILGLEQAPMTENRVKSLGEVVCAVNLQRLKDLLSSGRVWAFAVVLEYAKCAGSPFLDVRVRFVIKGEMYSVHLVGIVVQDMEMEESGDLVLRCLNVVAPDWRNLLIGVCSSNEGDKVRGCSQEIINRLVADCEFPIFGDAGVAIKIDQLMREACRTVFTADFTKMLITLIDHLRIHKLEIFDMGECPKFIEESWISVVKVLRWLVTNQASVMTHTEEYQYVGVPGPDWWIIALVVTSVADRVNDILRKIRDGEGLIYDRQRLVDLMNHLSMMTGAMGPFLGSEFFSISAEDIVIGSFSLNPVSTATFLKAQGEFANHAVDSLQPNAHQTLVDVTSTFVLTVLTKLHQIIIDITDVAREGSSSAGESGSLATNTVPPFLPNTLCKMRHQDFVGILEQQKPRLANRFSSEEIEQIEGQHRSLRTAYLLEKHVREELDGLPDSGSFAEVWREGICAGTDCRALRLFCGAMAAVASAPCMKDSGFALVNWCKISFSQSITDFSLEAILHAQSYRSLANLQRCL